MVTKGQLFNPFEVEPGEVLVMDEPSCLERDNINIAVDREYDDIGEILTNLTLSFDSYDGVSSTDYLTLLGDPTLMAEYDIIFLNCGIEWS